jgi:hypothetical protein
MILTTTNGVEFQVDEADLPLIESYRWFAGRRETTYYVYAPQKHRPKTLYLHRLLMRPAPGLEVDHINRDGLDNRRSNLRVVTHAINERNKPAGRSSKSGVRGVETSRHGTFQARYYVARKGYCLGTYKTVEEAEAAYLAATRGLR